MPDLLPLKNVKMKNSQRRVWCICIVCKNKGSLQPGWHETHCHCEIQVNLKLAILVCRLEEQHSLLTAENAHWSHSPGMCEVLGSILVLETKLLLATYCLENFQTCFPNHFCLFPFYYL